MQTAEIDYAIVLQLGQQSKTLSKKKKRKRKESNKRDVTHHIQEILKKITSRVLSRFLLSGQGISERKAASPVKGL